MQSLTWTGCETPTVLYQLQDHGHAWPGHPLPFTVDQVERWPRRAEGPRPPLWSRCRCVKAARGGRLSALCEEVPHEVGGVDVEFDQEAFCEAAGDFGTAQSGAPDASTPEEVEERLTAMSDAADAIVETAPEDVTEDAQAFADAIADFEQYGEDRDYEVDLGGGAPEYQSGEGATIGENITNTIAAVDQAVQDECGRFLSEAA